MKTKLSFIIILLIFTIKSGAQAVNYKLPGKGLTQHPFLYVGEWDSRHPEAQSMFLVREGKIVWKYSIPQRTATGGIQEFDDATLLSNGNILYACMSGAGIITPEKNLIWQYICPDGTETHSCQSIGKDSVLMALNANPAKVLIINTATNKILKEILIPTTTTSTHGQFRHVRITRKGTIMVPLLSENRVSEAER